MQGSLPVAWVVPDGGPSDEPPPVPGVEWVVVRTGELAGLGWEKPHLRVALVDLGPGASSELPPILGACPFPVLVRVPAERLTGVLPVLRERDDVCLTRDAPVLLAHRLKLLSNSDLDPLTQALDPGAYAARIDDALRGVGPERPLSLLHVNVDHMKRVNDEHGHALGHRVLRACAGLLQTGDGVRVARIGGDEFAVMAPGLDEPAAMAFAEQLCEVFATREWPGGVRLTVSVGVATADWAGATEATLGRWAALGMYKAKSAGRNRVVHFRGMEREAVRTGLDVQVGALEALEHVVSTRARQAITMRTRRVMEELQKRADSDGLTGLYNRGYLDRRLPRACQDARGGAAPLSVALIDVDHFGAINKALGWPAGDRALRDVADIVRGAVRAGDWVARYGGEELAVVLHGTNCTEAATVAERIRGTVERHAFGAADGQSLAVTVSVGVAELQPGETLQQLWDRLSRKLLDAKNEGRNRVRC